MTAVDRCSRTTTHSTLANAHDKDDTCGGHQKLPLVALLLLLVGVAMMLNSKIVAVVIDKETTYTTG